MAPRKIPGGGPKPDKLMRDARRPKVEPRTLGLLALAQRSVGRTVEAEATLADLWSRVPFYEKADWQNLFDERRTDRQGRVPRPARTVLSTTNVPFAMRLHTRPVVQPKYWLLADW